MEELNKKKIQREVLSAIAREMEVEVETSEVKIDSTIRDDLDIGSLDAMNIIMDLEDTFQIEIEYDEILEFTYVREIVDYLSKLLLKT